MPGRVESQQGRQSGQRRHGKGLRSSMPRRRCTRSNHCGPGTTAGSCPCSDSSGYGTKDCKGMPGRVESQQGRQSGQRRHRKGLRSSMPRRRCTRSNHCGPAPPPAPAPAPTAAATGQKTAKECREEWRANKAANQANGVTEKAYVAQCRGGAAPAQTTAAPAPPPAPAPAPTAAPAAPSRPGPPPPPDRRTGSQRSGKSRRGERIFNRSAG